MSNLYSDNAVKFDLLSLRERVLLGLTVLVVIIAGWMYFYADPLQAQIESRTAENIRIGKDVEVNRFAVQTIRSRIAAGVHVEKERQLAELRDSLDQIQQQLRLKTVELIDPEQMFDLMSQLIYQDSRLQLSALRREDVRPAIPVPEGQNEKALEPQIYRHVMAVEFSGSYLDMLAYIEELESLDWKLIWDEIEIIAQEYPLITVKLVMSTLSTDREWVGV